MNALRFVARALAIFGLFLFHGLRFVFGYFALLVTLRPREERKAHFAACMLDLFPDLGATSIKVGQIMSTRPALPPPHVVAALEKLQDDVGPFPYAQVHATIVAELGRPLEAIFEEFSQRPIASASVAQV